MIRLKSQILSVLIFALIVGFNYQSIGQVADEGSLNFSSYFVKMDRNSNNIYFKSGVFVAEEINNAQTGRIDYSVDEEFNGGFVRVIQFEKLPDNNLKSEMTAAGLILMDYIPNKAYVAHINQNITYELLRKWNVRALSDYTTNQKIDRYIASGQFPHYVSNGNKTRVIVHFYELSDFNIAYNTILSTEEFNVLNTSEENQQVEIEIPDTKITSLASNKYVKFIEIGHDPGEPDNFNGRTLHRSNALNTSFPGGKKYDGTGVVVMMQDDGDIGPHIDFNGRVDQSSANVMSSLGNHGDHVAGTFMGAGNLDPLAEGMAPGVFGFIYGNSNNHYNAVPARFTNDGLVITTKSYSNGCNAGYTSLTQQLDQQVNTYPSLVHVFSAGNSNGSNCGYGAGSQWGNITGGHKVGKNVITVANLNFIDQISSSSSRGPSTDGRIKPDISSKGSSVFSNDENYGYRTISGTSMACPGVTGVLAQLYHAYRDLNGNQDPNSALMKAVVLNTAEDIGNQGPDFIYGWGRINAIRAFNVLENLQYLDSSINNGATNTHILNVPSGVSRMKVMLYWKDPAAALSTSFDLVNDLNFQIIDQSLSTYSPLVLDPTPSPTLLNAPATPGIDNLNNMEQIVINNPTAGNFQLIVQGSMIPQGPQEYFITYLYEYSDVVELTYPIGGEPFVPGETQTLRWDAYGNTAPFNLEFSIDSGATWNSIASSVSSSLRYFNWTVPATSTEKALVRITRAAETDMSEATFTILPIPSNVNVVSSCTDSAALSWSAVAGADGYIVRKLGSQYMDSVTFTTGTVAFVNNVNLNDPDVWLSVQAVILDNSGTKITGYGRRANAIRKPTGLFNCPSEPPVAEFTADTTSICVGKTVKFFNETVNGSNSFLWTVTPGSHNFVNGTSANSAEPEIQFNSDDSYTVKLEAFNPGGSSIEEKIALINPFNPDIDLTEFFEASLSLPNGWNIESSNGPFDWDFLQLSKGSNNLPTKAAYFNRYSDVRLNQQDGLISKPVDLSGYTNPQLIFDLACTYQQNTPPNIAGGLRVDISEDCGFSFSPTNYLKSGADLITSPYSTFYFLPSSSSDWRRDTVDLGDFIGNQVLLKFVNISGVFGNSLFIDNVQIIENINVGIDNFSEISLSVFPNPTNGKFRIRSNNLENGDYQLSLIDSKGSVLNKIVLEVNDSKIDTEMDLSGYSFGLYTIKMISKNNTSISKITYLPN